MANRIVIGTQWGDEGKAKVIDYLTQQSDIVVRFQGGANAGHTVIVDDKKYVFHLLPAGILYPDKICVIGDGLVVDPEALIKEIHLINKDGVSVEGRLFISGRAHLVMPYHKELDMARENSSGKRKIGTTGRGIGPAYADKASRTGIRVSDLFAPEQFKEKVEANLFEKNALFKNLYHVEPLSAKAICEQYFEWADMLKGYVTDTSVLLNKNIRDGKNILFEGAQGTFLDINHGTYPFVTSSNTIAGAACTGAGIGPSRIDEVIGVVKAYTTRVGNGPFPTEFEEDIGKKIREEGNEYGATTGRPRRCGWLDAVMLRKAVELNGLDTIVVTKLDVLDKIESINVAIAYELNGKRIETFPDSVEELETVKPVYETLKGWQTQTSKCKSYKELPPQAKVYVERIQALTGTRIGWISVGPERKQTLLL